MVWFLKTQAEIDNFYLEPFIFILYDYVIRFKISMYDTFLMYIFNSFQDLRYDRLDLWFRKGILEIGKSLSFY